MISISTVIPPSQSYQCCRSWDYHWWYIETSSDLCCLNYSRGGRVINFSQSEISLEAGQNLGSEGIKPTWQTPVKSTLPLPSSRVQEKVQQCLGCQLNLHRNSESNIPQTPQSIQITFKMAKEDLCPVTQPIILIPKCNKFSLLDRTPADAETRSCTPQ